MKYREGDKVEIIDPSSEFYENKGHVLTKQKINDKIWVAFKPAKSTGHGFTSEQIKLIKSAIKGQEVDPCGCCISSSGYISANVLLEECPIRRELGQHEDSINMNFKEKVKVCTCISSNYAFGVPTCEYYKGLKEVIRGGRKVWRVSCDAVEV